MVSDSSFSMPVGPGIYNVSSDSNKSRFRTFRFFCLRENRIGPTRERGLFESLFVLKYKERPDCSSRSLNTANHANGVKAGSVGNWILLPKGHLTQGSYNNRELPRKSGFMHVHGGEGLKARGNWLAEHDPSNVRQPDNLAMLIRRDTAED